MEQEVLDQFNDLLGEYGKHKAFIDKATEQMGKFKADVIEKVIADHQIQSSLLEDQIGELVAQLQGAVEEINAGIQEAETSKGGLGERLEELELRRVIGEISDEEYETQSADGRGTVDSANSQIEELDGRRGVVEEALGRWADLSGTDVEIPVALPIEVPEPAAEEDSGDEDVAEVQAADEDDADEDAADEDAADEDDAEVADDEASEESVEVESGSDVDFGFEGEAGDVDVAASEEAESVEVEFDQDGDIGVELTGESSEGEVLENGGDPRRALLLYQEGTPEEQIYPFTGDVLTVGRGRDNDIQIKNDSKVSRFHCKLFRRGENFYVEDNKSSNGTLINGELITERRLFGGEEIIIGETFFRFRIM